MTSRQQVWRGTPEPEHTDEGRQRSTAAAASGGSNAGVVASFPPSPITTTTRTTTVGVVAGSHGAVAVGGASGGDTSSLLSSVIDETLFSAVKKQRQQRTKTTTTSAAGKQLFRQEWAPPPQSSDNDDNTSSSDSDGDGLAGGGGAGSGRSATKVPFSARAGDVYRAVQPVDLPHSELVALEQAAKTVTSTQQSLIGSVNQLVAAAQQQHVDTEGLSEQQQRLAARVDTVWKVSAEVRQEADAFTVSLRRHMSRFDEVTRHVFDEQRAMKAQLASLLAVSRRTAAQAARQAAAELSSRTNHGLLRRFGLSWFRHSRLRVLGMRLLAHTLLAQRRKIFHRWFGHHEMLVRDRALVASLAFLTQRTRKRLAVTSLVAWQRWLSRRKMQHRQASALCLGNERAHFRHVFRKLELFVGRCRRRAILQRALHTVQSTTKFGTRAAFYNRWGQFYRLMRNRRRSQKLALHLLGMIKASHLRRSFLTWRACRSVNTKQRDVFVELRKKNIILLLGAFWRRWVKYQHFKWLQTLIQSELAALSLRVEVSMRTASNTSETISKMLEYQHEIEEKLLDMAKKKVSYYQLRPAAFKDALDIGEFGGGGGVAAQATSSAFRAATGPGASTNVVMSAVPASAYGGTGAPPIDRDGGGGGGGGIPRPSDFLTSPQSKTGGSPGHGHPQQQRIGLQPNRAVGASSAAGATPKTRKAATGPSHEQRRRGQLHPMPSVHHSHNASAEQQPVAVQSGTTSPARRISPPSAASSPQSSTFNVAVHQQQTQDHLQRLGQHMAHTGAIAAAGSSSSSPAQQQPRSAVAATSSSPAVGGRPEEVSTTAIMRQLASQYGNNPPTSPPEAGDGDAAAVMRRTKKF